MRSEEILRAATKLFAQRGYHGVGMRLIAQEIGIRSASLYHHFAAKEDILYAITLSVSTDYIEEYLPLLDDPGTPAERLAALIRAHISYFWVHRVAEVVGRKELHALSEERRNYVNDHRIHYQRRIRDLIAAGQRSGAFSGSDPRLTSIAILDMINGVNRWYHDGGELTLEEVIAWYVVLVTDHLLGTPCSD